MTRTRKRSPEAERAITMRQAQQASSAASVAVASQAKTTSEGFAQRDITLADHGVRLNDLENPSQ